MHIHSFNFIRTEFRTTRDDKNAFGNQECKHNASTFTLFPLPLFNALHISPFKETAAFLEIWTQKIIDSGGNYLLALPWILRNFLVIAPVLNMETNNKFSLRRDRDIILLVVEGRRHGQILHVYDHKLGLGLGSSKIRSPLEILLNFSVRPHGEFFSSGAKFWFVIFVGGCRDFSSSVVLYNVLVI